MPPIRVELPKIGNCRKLAVVIVSLVGSLKDLRYEIEKVARNFAVPPQSLWPTLNVNPEDQDMTWARVNIGYCQERLKPKEL